MGESAAEGVYTSLTIGWVDSAIILAYLVGIVAIGCWAGFRRKNHEGDAYFLGGRTITWPVIGAALFAANISTVHMVSFAECGYKSGLLYGNFEWMAPFTLICLSLFFAPFYIRSHVTTLPDFLEKRYNRACRDWLAMLSIVAAIVIHIGFAFYTGARVLHGMFGIDTNVCIFVVAGLAGLYTIVGGLLAVMYTEAVQTIILLTGAICITVLGLHNVGGWQGLQEAVHPVNFSMIRPSSDPTGLSKWAVFLGYPIIGLWYWCCDQVIVQRVLAAKDENHARIGPLFTGFIKILPVFIFVLPGLICLGLMNKGIHTDPLADPKDTLTYLINHILPTGMKGIMAAALLAAMMGSVSAALNSIATVFSYDVVKRWWPETSDHKLVLCGRIVTAVAMALSIAWSPLVGRFETIFQGLNDLICYMAPPVTVVFLFGVFWRKASGKAALITLLSGSVLGAIVFMLQLFLEDMIGGVNWLVGANLPLVKWEIHSMISGFVMFLVGAATLAVFSHLYPDAETAERSALVWKSPLDPLRGTSWRFLGDYRVIAALLFVTMVGLYWQFSGSVSYYPVQVRIVRSDGTPVVGAEVAFESDSPKYHFVQVTDFDGRFAYGSKIMAGGAPAGAYRVKIVPSPLAATIPAKYGSFDSSGLLFRCEPKQNQWDLQLDSADSSPPVPRVARPVAYDENVGLISPKNTAIRLFNGKNLDGLYTWLKDARYEDPRNVFTVEDGLLHISGDGLGYVCTKQRYKDYHLLVEYRWGERTWLHRRTRAKDSGVIVHCTEPDGSDKNVFMAGIEAQIIEGGTGDLIVVPGKRADGSDIPVSLTAETTKDPHGETVWQKGGRRVTLTAFERLNWFGRDPDWKDVLGYRGRQDIDSPGRAWTRLDVICDGGRIIYRVNGIQANEAFDAAPSSGKILIQCEAAEIYVRRFELQPLKR